MRYFSSLPSVSALCSLLPRSILARDPSGVGAEDATLLYQLDSVMPSVFSDALKVVTGLAAASSVSYAPVHYAPNATKINNLVEVINGTGSPGIFNSSVTPDSEYGTYNWCNMPHVRAKEYIVPADNLQLRYVEVIHRHHKRTPYASNTFFKEDISWNCSSFEVYHYGKNTTGASSQVAPINWHGYGTGSYNPMSTTVGPGFVGSDCQFPQITDGGLADSHQHGKDLAGVYKDKLKFISKDFKPDEVSFRVSNNDITSQVLGALAAGLYPQLIKSGYSAYIQPSAYDSLEPTYTCNAANDAHNYEGSDPDWTAHLTAASSLYEKLDSVSGISTNDTAGWHTSFDHYFDNLSAKLCHGRTLPCSTNSSSVCVTQEEADTVFRLGQYEYSYRYRDAANSTLYSNLHYGAWLYELRAHLTTATSGSSSMKYRHNVAHDGSISPLLGILQAAVMVWPGMGAELVFELWLDKKVDHNYLRVLWGGQPLKTSTPLGTLDMIKLEDFFSYLDQQLPSDLVQACH